MAVHGSSNYVKLDQSIAQENHCTNGRIVHKPSKQYRQHPLKITKVYSKICDGMA